MISLWTQLIIFILPMLADNESESGVMKEGLIRKQLETEMAQFPKYDLKEEELIEQVPEVFSLGGNKELNMKLYHHRKQKLKEIENTIAIECQDLGKAYQLEGEESVLALHDVTLKGPQSQGAIKKGQFVIIRGPSGGGKTTFLNLLGTIDKPSSGIVCIDGRQTDYNSDSETSKLRRDKIGIVFQTFNLLALMSAYENIELPMRIKGKLSEKEMKSRVKYLLSRVNLLERADHLPSQLSGGEQQRVAISRSLSNAPSIILLDEPTGDLDSKATIEIMNLILEINNFGYSEENPEKITIVMVTHNQDLECYADRLLFVQDGSIHQQVLNQYQFALDPQEYSQFLNTKV